MNWIRIFVGQIPATMMERVSMGMGTSVASVLRALLTSTAFLIRMNVHWAGVWATSLHPAL